MPTGGLREIRLESPRGELAALPVPHSPAVFQSPGSLGSLSRPPPSLAVAVSPKVPDILQSQLPLQRIPMYQKSSL